MQFLQFNDHLQELHTGHGCFDLTRTDLFHASVQRVLRTLFHVKANAQQCKIAVTDVVLLFLRKAKKKYENSRLML